MPKKLNEILGPRSILRYALFNVLISKPLKLIQIEILVAKPLLAIRRFSTSKNLSNDDFCFGAISRIRTPAKIPRISSKIVAKKERK